MRSKLNLPHPVKTLLSVVGEREERKDKSRSGATGKTLELSAEQVSSIW